LAWLPRSARARFSLPTPRRSAPTASMISCCDPAQDLAIAELEEVVALREKAIRSYP
jgi:hypothetical protein